ncbi:MAG: hypothetical protein NTAFB05_05890 [Nitrobacter sp.]|uniref:P-loop ATPase, Sll1717 family n=1 Tax=Nitrobacter sp. TaxID=29420 RepID=UPI00387DED8F
MAVNAFLAAQKFVEDPFQSTNAGEEPKLERYFVPPPYFSSVLGDADNPKSQVILAPRGGGKTAQRVMIEKSSESQAFLCATYDDFPISTKFSLNDATLDYHLKNIATLILLGILFELDRQPQKIAKLSDQDKQILKFQIERFLGTFSAEEFERALKSLKNFGDKANDLWNKYGGKIAALINAFIAKYGFGAIDATQLKFDDSKRDEQLKFHIRRQVEIAKKCGLRSIYILIDRVDETVLTGADARQSFALVRSLISDLPTLETKGIAFKFFLWDKLKDEYVSHGARPDRIKIFELNWKTAELEKMLSERLREYSHGVHSSFNSLTDTQDLNTHRLVAWLGAGSPRDMIRVCGRIVDEHTRSDPISPTIPKETIFRGIQTFAQERAEELFGNSFIQLKKLATATFTVNQLASDVLRISVQAARNRIGPWQNSGAIKKIDEIENQGSRPLHLYGVSDLRLLIALFPKIEINQLLENWAYVCPSCGTVVISDRKELVCECGERIQATHAQSLLSECKLRS